MGSQLKIKNKRSRLSQCLFHWKTYYFISGGGTSRRRTEEANPFHSKFRKWVFACRQMQQFQGTSTAISAYFVGCFPSFVKFFLSEHNLIVPPSSPRCCTVVSDVFTLTKHYGTQSFAIIINRCVFGNYFVCKCFHNCNGIPTIKLFHFLEHYNVTSTQYICRLERNRMTSMCGLRSLCHSPFHASTRIFWEFPVWLRSLLLALSVTI